MFEPTHMLLPYSMSKAIPIIVVTEKTWKNLVRNSPASLRRWARDLGFDGKPGSLLQVPGGDGGLDRVYAGVTPDDDGYGLARHAAALPEGTYQLHADEIGPLPFAEQAWAFEAYAFTTYKKRRRAPAKIMCRKTQDYDAILRTVQACCLVRDLVNTPANDLGPDELEATARQVAKAHNARIAVTSGPALARNFPMIQAVGAASARRPRLVDMVWGNARHPRLTLVGKGVCFDSGGLDIKPASGMALMKKDMGGAAHVLGLASMIMAARLPLRLRVLLPVVENAISGSAFRPGDVLRSRKGLTVEIGNTDAEGRLILADALHLADEERPDLLIDMATLTGAARVALGPDIPPFFTDDDDLAEAISRHAKAQRDPLWRLPLWRPYEGLFESQIADMNNAGEGGFAGSITAALFLRRFVEQAKSYVHFDIFAWAPSARPGTPKGGEAQAIRALFALLAERYAK